MANVNFLFQSPIKQELFGFFENKKLYLLDTPHDPNFDIYANRYARSFPLGSIYK